MPLPHHSDANRYLYETSVFSFSFKPCPKTGRCNWIAAFAGMMEKHQKSIFGHAPNLLSYRDLPIGASVSVGR